MNIKSTRLLMIVAVMLTVITVVAMILLASGVSEQYGSIPEEKFQIPHENSSYALNSSKKSNGSVKIKISPSEAQKIAQKYLKEPGAKVGIPQLDEVNGQMVYTVPIQINGTNVGEITINALTGENMGGAGGAP